MNVSHAGNKYGVAQPPAATTIEALREAAAECRACPLWERATQTVFGDNAAHRRSRGGDHARFMMIGEQPGDSEDLEGIPFVGPAGKLLDKALADAGIAREEVYVTNTVKHFKWEPLGKRRLHKKPSPREIAACRPWLEAELALVEPEIVICLGATSSQALFGPQFRVTRQRGQMLPSPFSQRTMATVHPSSILRARDSETRHHEYKRFVEDLRAAKAAAIP